MVKLKQERWLTGKIGYILVNSVKPGSTETCTMPVLSSESQSFRGLQ
jgi:hypothetical protein